MPIPIVLVHGILGFDRIKFAGKSVAEYFHLVPETLRNDGHVVPEPPALNTAGSIKERATNLQNYLNTQTDVAKKNVHIIAHSMGGLDTRYAISKLGLANRIVSLTTIGTPHLGSPIADLVEKGLPPLAAKALAEIGIDVKGFQDLTTTACAQFNKDVVDSGDVQYFAIAGLFQPSLLAFPPQVLGATHAILEEKEGDNDGVVSVTSARFGDVPPKAWTVLDKWSGDHFRLINWGTNILPVDDKDQSILDRYRALAQRLAAIA